MDKIKVGDVPELNNIIPIFERRYVKIVAKALHGLLVGELYNATWPISSPLAVMTP